MTRSMSVCALVTGFATAVLGVTTLAPPAQATGPLHRAGTPVAAVTYPNESLRSWWEFLGLEAQYKIINYSAQHKHLIVADKNADGVVACISIRPQNQNRYLNYCDENGVSDGAKHFDIYYPVDDYFYCWGTQCKLW